MENLWAPWRIEYILGKRETYCIFCPEGGGHSDEERLILYRGERVMVMMNKYPYNNGHLLAVPYRHVDTLEALTAEEATDMMAETALGIRALRLASNPEGFNIGVNIGKIAGAGVIDHVHAHVVPRWGGDTNFMPVLADAKVIVEHLEEAWGRIRKGFEA